MKSFRITITKRLIAIAAAIAVLAGTIPGLFLTAFAESENHSGCYTFKVMGKPAEGITMPQEGADVSIELYDSMANGALLEEINGKTGADGVLELPGVQTAFEKQKEKVEPGSVAPETAVYLKIKTIQAFGYKCNEGDLNAWIRITEADLLAEHVITLDEKDTRMLTGRVTAKDIGTELSGVSVKLSPGDITTTTNEEGYYEFDGVYQDEEYDVTASHMKYLSHTESVGKQVITVSLVLELKAENEDFHFGKRTPAELTIPYGKDGNVFQNSIFKGGELGDIHYEIIEEKAADGSLASTNTVATINGADGTLQILAAGFVTVAAYNEDNYKEYTLIIERVRYDISFLEEKPVVIFDKNSGVVNRYTNNLLGGSGGGAVEYSIEQDKESGKEYVTETDVADIDAATGELTLKKGGIIKVRALKKEDASHLDTEVFYELTVKKTCTLTGTVTDTDGATVSGVLLQFSPGDISATTGTEGVYQVDEICEGLEYEMTASHKDYTTQSQSIVVGSNRVDMTLEKKTKSADFQFETSGEQSVIYGENMNIYENPACQRGGGGGAVQYEIFREENADGEPVKDTVATIDADGTLHIYTAGTVTVRAFNDRHYAYYTLEIRRGEWESISFQDLSPLMTYGKNQNEFSGKLQDAQGGGTIQYSIEQVKGSGKEYVTETDVADINAKCGKVTIKKAGTIKVRARKLANACYRDKDAFYELTIKKAEQEELVFDKPGDATMTYGDWDNKYPNPVSGGSGTGKVTYKIIEGADIAAIDSGTGELTIHSAGRVTVKAVKASDDCYLEQHAQYTLVIEKAPQEELVYEKPQYATLIYGERDNKYLNPVSGGSGTGEVTYKIIEGADIAAIDSGTGELTISSDGKVTVRAVKASDSCYLERSADYTVNIRYEPTEELPVLEGTKKNGWYTSAITIKAPEGYLISTENEPQSSWEDAVSYQKEGIGDHIVYLRKRVTGGITDAIILQNLQIDTKKPLISYQEKSSGSYLKQKKTVTITVTDPQEGKTAYSGLDIPEVKLFIEAKNAAGSTAGASWKDLTKPENWSRQGNVWKSELTFSADAIYHVKSITCSDLAGNVSTAAVGDTFTLDQTAPATKNMKISYSEELNTWEKLIDKVTFGYYSYKKGVTVTLTAKDTLSGIEKLDWSYQQEKGTSTTKNVKERSGSIPASKLNYSEDGLTAAGTFRLTAKEAEQFRGKISFTATDKAGNTGNTKKDAEKVLIVDTITPKRTVTYSPAKQVVDAKTMKTKSSYSYSAEGTDSILYYDGSITVSLEIREANFYPEDVALKVNDKKRTVKNWRQEGDTWKGSIRITGEGSYVVTMSYKDRSNNQMKNYTSGQLVIDKKAPVIQVDYGTQEGITKGGRTYFDKARTAVITVREKNFRASDVAAEITATDIEGSNVDVMDYEAYLSSQKNWKQEGNAYKAEITFPKDANYTFGISYQDLAGRNAPDYGSDRFTVDQTAPVVEVTNIRNQSANKDEIYGFTITATDTNLDLSSFRPVLSAVVKKEDGTYSNQEIPFGAVQTVSPDTCRVTVENLDLDAVYSLNCVVKDLAGNEYSNLQLASDGNEYETVKFSVNRKGSTFTADKEVEELINRYYVYRVEDDVVIEEINVDPVENYEVKLNGELLTEGSDYTTELSNKEGEWSKRSYSVKKELFEEEREYHIVVTSTDKTNTTSYSDVKGLNVSFVIDQTAPELTVGGIEEGGRYQTQSQTVTVIPTDNGGKVQSFRAEILDADGAPYTGSEGKAESVRFDLSGEKLETYLAEHNGEITFTVPEGVNNQLLLTCGDSAYRADGSSNVCSKTFTALTVSQSGFVIFLANKPLLYATAGGAAAFVLAAAGLLVLLRKRKRA